MNQKLGILLAASAMFTTACGLIGPIYAVFVENIGGDILTAGTTYGLYSIVAGVMIFLISRWEDHVKHQEKLVVIGYAVAGIGFLGYIFIRTPIELFIVQMIFGFSEAIKTPAYDGLYSKFLDRGKFISEWGMWESMYYIVTAASAGVGALIAEVFGFRTLFMIMFGFSMTGVLISSRLYFGNRSSSRTSLKH
jgi:hypothetical protein